MGEERKDVNRNILVAVDDSENSRRAVIYVADMLAGIPDVRVTLLHVIPDPEEDFFPSEKEKASWLSSYRIKLDGVLRDYRGILLDAGFLGEAVTVRIFLKNCPSLATCILEERDKTEYGTVVVGRQGLSRSEEFLFGSISSKIVSHAKNCAVWVVG